MNDRAYLIERARTTERKAIERGDTIPCFKCGNPIPAGRVLHLCADCMARRLEGVD